MIWNRTTLYRVVEVVVIMEIGQQLVLAAREGMIWKACSFMYLPAQGM
jgi:hypothetical protein